MDRATRPNHPSSEPEMLPDRPLPTSVDMDPSPPPLEIASSITPSSLVPTDISDEASASFHSTPDFHHTPQTLSSHTYLELPTTIVTERISTLVPHQFPLPPVQQLISTYASDELGNPQPVLL